ncbi:MAG TPA: ADP-ribosylation factor-like protein, partial [Candidatus Lokiarchaeia archaeon]
KIIKVEKNPTTAIASRRKMKILFTGLDDTGKTSFLLSIDKKYSKLLSLKPTLGTEVISIDALGASFFVWDLGGQISSRERYINKAHIYLYESDLLFYFIDVRNKSRFEESLEYLQNIFIQLNKFEQHPPIIFVFSKGDADILNSDEIKDNIKFLRSQLIEFTSNKNPEIYITSIFSTFSILRAFSSGISKLSPNRDLIKLNLKKFSKKIDTPLSLLLNKDGLALADYYSKKLYSLITIKNQTELKEGENLRNVFEVSAPQFATLYKIFSQFKTLKEEETIFQFNENLKVLLKKIQVSDNEIYILFLIDNEIKKKKINDLLPDFIKRISDLLIR